MTDSTDADSKLLDDARQALACTPHYILHIGAGLASTVRQLQTGNSIEGMDAFARSMSDLGQFMSLLREMQRIARLTDCSVISAFRDGVGECVEQLNDAVRNQDLDALSDGIQGALLPLLPTWEQVAYQLQDGFELQQ
jgi:hypothetical protein